MKRLNYSLSFLMAVLMLSFGSLQAQYCDGPINNANDEWITNVTFANVNNTTAFGVSTANTINGTATVSPNEDVDFSVEVTTDGGPWAELIVIYFDFDNDFVFETELDLGSNTINNSSATYDASTAPGGSNTVTMPSTPGTYRMRVVLDFFGPVPGPCDSDNGSSFKDSEDYEIVVGGGGGGPSCSDGIQNGNETGVDCGGPDCPPCDVGCQDNAITLTIITDDFAGETSWNIEDENGNEVAGIAQGEYSSGTENVEDLCLPDGCYTLNIEDSFGDGICCSFGEGSYSLEDADGNVLASGGEFDDLESTPFCVEGTPVPEGDLPFPWVTIDVGGEECNAYGYDEGNGEFAITGCGNNAVPLNSDNVAFGAQLLCGDSEITAKVEDVSSNGYGGLMMRDAGSANGKQVSIFSNLTNILRHEVRYSPGTNKIVSAFNRPAPIWLRLQRQGNWVFAYYSTTGTNFQYVQAVMVPFDACIEVGMAAFSFTPGATATATFSNVSVSGGDIPTVETPGVEAAALTRNQARLFPNPAQSQVTVDFAPHAELSTFLTLRNELGQVVEERQLEPQAMRTEWAISSLVNGVYFVEIRRDGEVPQVLRFVKTN